MSSGWKSKVNDVPFCIWWLGFAHCRDASRSLEGRLGFSLVL